MGVLSSTLLKNCFVENIETIVLGSYFLKHKFWGRYMDDIISVWNYGVEELKSFLEHLNFWGGDLKITIELEEDNKLPFLDVLLLKMKIVWILRFAENLLTITDFCRFSLVMLAK